MDTKGLAITGRNFFAASLGQTVNKLFCCLVHHHGRCYDAAGHRDHVPPAPDGVLPDPGRGGGALAAESSQVGFLLYYSTVVVVVHLTRSTRSATGSCRRQRSSGSRVQPGRSIGVL